MAERGAARLNEGSEEKIVDAVMGHAYEPTEAGVYFIGPLERSPALQYLALRDRKIVVLHRLDKDVDWGLSLSPDRRSLIYSQIDALSADLMLVENFP